MFVCLTVLILNLCLFENVSGQNEAVRLPKNLRPYKYFLTIRPDIYSPSTGFPFNGSVIIDFDVASTTNQIVLNQLRINVRNFLLFLAPENTIPGANVPRWQSPIQNDVQQTVVINLNGTLTEGAKYRMLLIFNGEMELASNNGMYVDYYDVGEVRRYLVASQFQIDHARKAFPCFDEPEFKAVFKVTIERKRTRTALGNGELERTRDIGDGWLADEFSETPTMSCYLVALVVSDFTKVETRSPKGKLVRLWAQPEKAKYLNFSAGVAGRIQDWFEDYTGIEYQTSKMDHVAVPSRGGAMENWGLIQYGETELLYDPENSIMANKVRVALVLAHEIAHQWFGNMVTCKWWDHTWLNEGFAAFFQWQPLEAVLNWDIGLVQKVRDEFSIIKQDETSASLTVQRPDIQKPSQAPSGFSGFTYRKGGAMLRMLEQMIGQSTFQKGLKKYLADFAYKSAVTDNLWTSIQAVVEEDGVTLPNGNVFPVKEIMDSWVLQLGIPLLNVTRSGNALKFDQKRYLQRPDLPVPPSDYNYIWNIPITLANDASGAGNMTTVHMVRTRDDEYTSPSDLGNWFALNSLSTGYYRIAYDSQNEEALINKLKSNVNAVDRIYRAQLLDDAFSYTSNGYRREVEALSFTTFLKNENTAGGWISAINGMSRLYERYTDFNSEEIGKYTRSIVDTMYNQFGFEPVQGEDDFIAFAREIVSSAACSFGNQNCINKANELVNIYREQKDNRISPNQRYTAYCTSLSSGDKIRENFFFFEEQQKKTNELNFNEINDLVAAQACVSDQTEVNMLDEYLDRIIKSEDLFYPDLERVTRLIDLSASSRGRNRTLERIDELWVEDFPNGNRASVLLGIARNCHTPFTIQKVRDQMIRRPAEGLDLVVYEEIESALKANEKWTTENFSEIDNWFKNNVQATVNEREIFSYSLFEKNFKKSMKFLNIQEHVSE